MQLYERIYEMKQPCSKILGGNKLREVVVVGQERECRLWVST